MPDLHQDWNRLVRQPQIDTTRQQCLKRVPHRLDGRAQRQGIPDRRLLNVERQQLGRQSGRPFPASENLFHRPLQRVIRLQLGDNDAGLAPDHRENLIELIGQFGGQAADRLELLSFSKLPLQAGPLHHALPNFLIRA